MALDDRALFVKDWNDYTESKNLETSDARNALASRVNEYLKISTAFFEDKAGDWLKQSAETVTPVSETPKNEVAVASPKAQKAMERALNAKIYDDSESKMKKILAATTTAADKLGLLEKTGFTPTEISTGADVAFMEIKTAFQVGNGLLTGQEATDIMVDTAAARLGAALEMTVKGVLHGAAEAVNAFVAAHCPPATVITRPLLNVAASWAGSKVGKAVNKGVQKIAEHVKPVVREVRDTIKTYASRAVETVKSKVSSTVSKVKSFFKSIF